MSEDFEPVRAVGQGNDLTSDIETWISSPPLCALIDAFGTTQDDPPSHLGLGARLDWLDAFTKRWDTRQGKERDQAEELALSSEQDALVVQAATALGFRQCSSPLHKQYDHVMMLGGLFRACITRPAHAANLIHEGRIHTGSVTALGGHRPFSDQERDLARRTGFDGLDEEFAALDAGTSRAFHLSSPDSVEGERLDSPGGSWTLHRYTASEGFGIVVAAAPSSEPERRRANTADSYGWWANNVARLGSGDKILAVTTAIYVPAQQAAAIRMLTLPFGVEVETVGIEPGDVDPTLAQPFTATKYLLEVRSAIRSLRDLFEAIESG